MPRLRHLVFDGLIDKPCLEGIAHLRQLVSLELPGMIQQRMECLSGLKFLQHLTCTWSGAQQPIAWHELSALQSLTVLADPHSFDWEAVKSLPKLQAVQVRSRELQTIGNALGMRFVPIPMTLPGKKAEVIYMQQAEVTYEQYRKFKVAAGLATTEAERIPSDQPLAPNDFDSWKDASRFIDQLNQWDTKYVYRMVRINRRTVSVEPTCMRKTPEVDSHSNRKAQHPQCNSHVVSPGRPSREKRIGLVERIEVVNR